MHKDFTMAIIQNDLDSMAMRIEALEAHPELTNAGEFVRRAKEAMIKARGDIHQRDTKDRFAKMDANR
jgi:hypothetical protein